MSMESQEINYSDSVTSYGHDTILSEYSECEISEYKEYTFYKEESDVEKDLEDVRYDLHTPAVVREKFGSILTSQLSKLKLDDDWLFPKKKKYVEISIQTDEINEKREEDLMLTYIELKAISEELQVIMQGTLNRSSHKSHDLTQQLNDLKRKLQNHSSDCNKQLQTKKEIFDSHVKSAKECKEINSPTKIDQLLNESTKIGVLEGQKLFINDLTSVQNTLENMVSDLLKLKRKSEEDSEHFGGACSGSSKMSEEKKKPVHQSTQTDKLCDKKHADGKGSFSSETLNQGEPQLTTDGHDKTNGHNEKKPIDPNQTDTGYIDMSEETSDDDIDEDITEGGRSYVYKPDDIAKNTSSLNEYRPTKDFDQLNSLNDDDQSDKEPLRDAINTSDKRPSNTEGKRPKLVKEITRDSSIYTDAIDRRQNSDVNNKNDLKYEQEQKNDTSTPKEKQEQNDSFEDFKNEELLRDEPIKNPRVIKKEPIDISEEEPTTTDCGNKGEDPTNKTEKPNKVSKPVKKRGKSNDNKRDIDSSNTDTQQQECSNNDVNVSKEQLTDSGISNFEPKNRSTKSVKKDDGGTRNDQIPDNTIEAKQKLSYPNSKNIGKGNQKSKQKGERNNIKEGDDDDNDDEYDDDDENDDNGGGSNDDDSTSEFDELIASISKSDIGPFASKSDTTLERNKPQRLQELLKGNKRREKIGNKKQKAPRSGMGSVTKALMSSGAFAALMALIGKFGEGPSGTPIFQALLNDLPNMADLVHPIIIDILNIGTNVHGT